MGRVKQFNEQELQEHRKRRARERYYNSVRFEQLERVMELVENVQSMEYKDAVLYVQNNYRVREFQKGE